MSRRNFPMIAALSMSIAGSLVAALPLLTGCGGTSTGNPLVTLSFSNYVAHNWLEELFISTAYASTSNVKICLAKLRFKMSDGTIGENLTLTFGEVPLSTTGTNLGSVTAPTGTYSRIEFDLDTSCASGKSVQMTNANGSFVSTDTITIRFDGTISFSTGSSKVLPLAIQNIMSQLNNVAANANSGTSSPDIKTYAQAAGGTF